MQTSIVPNTEHVTYLLLDQVGSYGPIWREMSDGEANEATIIDWTAQGQFDCPLRVVASGRVTSRGKSRRSSSISITMALPSVQSPETDRTRLRKPKMMWVGWLPPADEARL